MKNCVILGDSKKFSRVINSVNGRIERGVLPGVTLRVMLNGECVLDYTAGYSNIEEKIPLRRDSVFRLASMTKPITAAAALWCAERGKLRLSDKISKYFPAFARSRVGKLDGRGKVAALGAAEREITVEDILTHSSGLGSGEVGDAQFASFPRAHVRTPREAVEHYGEWLLDFSPGTSQMYSPLAALDVVAAIVEKVTDTEYESFLRERIFLPLGMTDTGYNLTEEQYGRVVKMCRLGDSADKLEPHEMGREGHDGFPVGAVSGCTAMFGTACDYTRFAQMLCSDGEFGGQRVLSPESVRLMRAPHFKNGFAGMDEYSNWGYTVRVRQRQTENVQELSPLSYGWSGAYNTHFWVDPELKIVGVYMSNMSNAGGAGAITAFEFECDVMRSLKDT